MKGASKSFPRENDRLEGADLHIPPSSRWAAKCSIVCHRCKLKIQVMGEKKQKKTLQGASWGGLSTWQRCPWKQVLGCQQNESPVMQAASVPVQCCFGELQVLRNLLSLVSEIQCLSKGKCTNYAELYPYWNSWLFTKGSTLLLGNPSYPMEHSPDSYCSIELVKIHDKWPVRKL